MKSAQRRIAIKAIAGLALACACTLALAAQLAGTVVNLSGPLMAHKANGSIKVLALRSEVEQGDTLVSEKNTYAQIRLVDNSEITLRPGTTFKIEAFAYDVAKPEADNASFTLLKGGLRSITGLLGKRNKEKFLLKTPSATIGIRGTTFLAQYVASDGAPAAGALAPGLHVFVSDGVVLLSNGSGALAFSAGQSGFVAGAGAPVVVPPNPALQFAPPPAFEQAVGPGPAASAPGAAGAELDCEVR